LNNNTGGVREREDANRTREAGHLDEIQGVVANTQNLFCRGPLASWTGWRLLHPDRLRIFARDLLKAATSSVAAAATTRAAPSTKKRRVEVAYAHKCQERHGKRCDRESSRPHNGLRPGEASREDGAINR